MLIKEAEDSKVISIEYIVNRVMIFTANLKPMANTCIGQKTSSMDVGYA